MEPAAWSRRFLTRATKRVPRSVKSVVLERHLAVWPPVGTVRLGSFRRRRPISPSFGFDRGTPVDRYYIQQFIDAQQQGATGTGGKLLEFGDDRYTRRLLRLPADAPRPTRVDVWDIDPANATATIVADLASTDVEAGPFDCIICTQVLLLIYDVRAAVGALSRMLAPGGLLLVTVPGISKICREEADASGDYWRFTTWSLRRLLEETADLTEVEVCAFGNVLSATAFLHGLAAEELSAEDLEAADDDFQLVVAARARKRG